jgi:transposase
MKWKQVAEEQAARIIQLEAQLKVALEEIARLKKNSATSSKPPSSDIVKPKKDKDRRRKKKIGGQKGHKQHFRTPFTADQVDHIEECTLDSCPKCGGTLALTNKPPKTHQQVELVDKPFIITEFQQHEYWCEQCQCYHTAALPAEVRKSGLFGQKLMALTGYLKGRCHMSYTTMQSFYSDALRIRVSRGFLAKQIQKVSKALEKPYEELKEQLPKEDHVHADETSHKKNGKLHWTWCFRVKLFTLFHIDPSRGSIVLEEILGKDFDGKISCDFFGAYQKFARMSDTLLLLCWAHLIREVKFLAESKDKPASRYGKRLLSEIQKMFHTIHRRGEILDRTWFRYMAEHRESILKEAQYRVPKKSKVAVNLSKRLWKHHDEYFRFIELGLPPTNNLAEQSIRRVVLNRKVTQGTRSDWGNRWWERIWSVLSTCEQQGKNVMAFLNSAIDSLFQGLDPPKLLQK